MDKFFAGLGLLVCALLALRMAAGPARVQRFDEACRRHYRLWATGLVHRWRTLRRSGPAPARTGDARAAQREAEQVIERARRHNAEHDGNVIRPRAFGAKKKPPLH